MLASLVSNPNVLSTWKVHNIIYKQGPFHALGLYRSLPISCAIVLEAIKKFMSQPHLIKIRIMPHLNTKPNYW